MHLLLLGCSGFIGSELVPKLIKSGHQLTIVSRKKGKRFISDNSSNQIIYLKTNPAISSNWEQIELIEAIKKADGIINLVGEPISGKRWTKKQRQEIENSRINTTKNLIQSISTLKAKPKVLIQGSAIGFYGTSPDEIFSEKSPSGKDFLANLCNKWEQIALNASQKTRLVILRTGIVLEKDGGALGKMLPVFQAGFGGPIGNGMQWMSWIHRTDLCQIIENALTNKAWEGIYNGVSPKPVRMKEFSKALGKVLNRPSLIPLPAPLLQLLLGDGAKVVLEGQIVISNRLEKNGFHFQYPELNKALETIKNH